jgi:hypothetical protein
MCKRHLRIVLHILSRHADVLSICRAVVVQNWAGLHLRCSTISALNYWWWQAELGPGDTLYTPPGWWHCVTTDSTSVSLLSPLDPHPQTEDMPLTVLSV